MSKSGKTSEETAGEQAENNGVAETSNNVQETVMEAPKQFNVPNLGKVDVSKVVEERRKVIESGKQVNK